MKRLKVVRKARYVKGLRRILEKKVPCSCCPIGITLEQDGFYSKWPCRRGSREEKLCYDFIGRNVPSAKEQMCPCMNFGKEALTQARAAIALWDKGEHPWQKGKKK